MKTIGVLSGVALAMYFVISPTLAAERKQAAKGKAAAATQQHKLSEWQIGPVLFGDKASAADLKGKVVVIENWGVHCPPCVASLPHLAELDKKFRDKGLRIIGAESQGSAKEAIKPLLDRANVEYTITAGASGPIPVTGIPRCFVFDAQGALVYDGYPAGPGFEKSIKDALKNADAGEPSDTPVAVAGPLIPTQTWTNADGREIRAAVKRVDATNVTFLMPNDKEVVYPLAKLSEKSRDTIAEATQARP